MQSNIRRHKGVPTLFVNGEPASSHWCFCSPEYASDFTGADIRIFDVSLPHFRLNHAWWRGPERFDFSFIIAEMEDYLKAAPDALFVPRFHTGLAEADWFPELFPEECNLAVRLDNGQPDVEYRHPGIGKPQHSMASEVWRELAANACRRYVETVEDCFGDRIMGYHVGGGFSAEWFTWHIVNEGSLDDYSDPMRRAFRTFLRDKYGDDRTLEEAWQRKGASIDTAEIPSVFRRANPSLGAFYSTRSEQDIIDYQECYGHEAAQSCTHLCRTVKDATDWKKVVGVFNGYLLVFCETNVPQRTGHLGFGEVLDSEAIDFICSPYHYEYRGWGQNHHAQTLPASVAARGKLYVDEIDTNPSTSRNPFYWIEHMHDPANLTEFCEMLKRDYAYNHAMGTSFWWMDLKYEGWYHADEITDTLRMLVRAEAMTESVEKGPVAEIAVVLDPSSYAAAFPGPVHQEPYITHLIQWELPRIGAPFDVLLIDDFLAQLHRYKLALFPMTPNLGVEKARALMEAIERKGISTVWFHAPGYANDDSKLQKLVGWRWRYGTAGFPGVRIRNPYHWLTRGIDEGAEYGRLADIRRKREDGYKWKYEENVSAPGVIIDDDESTFIGALVSGEGVGLAVKETAGRFSVLSSAPALNSRLLRNAAQRSGAHIYGPLGDIVYAGRNFVGISAGFEGTHRVSLPEQRRVVDLQTGEELGNAIAEFGVELAYGHCALLGTFPGD